MSGYYLRSNGRTVAIAALSNRHLLNAYLKALELGKDDERVVRPLAAEVVRRDLCAQALVEAERRDRS